MPLTDDGGVKANLHWPWAVTVELDTLDTSYTSIADDLKPARGFVASRLARTAPAEQQGQAQQEEAHNGLYAALVGALPV